MITLLVCGSMLTSVAFGREHILLGFDSLVLNGPDIPSGCFDPYALTILDSPPEFWTAERRVVKLLFAMLIIC